MPPTYHLLGERTETTIDFRSQVFLSNFKGGVGRLGKKCSMNVGLVTFLEFGSRFNFPLFKGHNRSRMARYGIPTFVA